METKLFPEPISFESTEKIVGQMKKSICEIDLDDNYRGTGFFCKIPFPDNDHLLPVLITSSQIINESLFEKQITLKLNNSKTIKAIELKNRITYTDEKYGITVIEMKEKRDGKTGYLELDNNIDNLNDSYSNLDYTNKSVYILEYYNNNKMFLSYGLLNKIEDRKNKFNYLFNANTSGKGSFSGGPILNLSNNKLFGLQTENGKGIFLYKAIKVFIEKEYYNKLEIRKFNERFQIDLKDNNITVLDLSKKHMGNDDFEYIKKIDPIELKELNLSVNDISDLKLLDI